MIQDTNALKKCKKCNEEKSFSEFRKCKKYKDGYEPKCKSCSRSDYEKLNERARLNYANGYKNTIKEKRKQSAVSKSNELLAVGLAEFICKCGMGFATKLSYSTHKKSCSMWVAKDGYKICRKCECEKLLTEFNKSKLTKDGYYFWCRQCDDKVHTSRRNENIEKYKEKEKLRYWTKQELFINQRNKHREKLRLKDKIYREKNTEKIRDKVYERNKLESKSLKMKGKLYRDKLINETIELLGGKCAICSEATKEFLAIDHIHDNGSTDRKNKHHLGWKRDILDGKVSKDDYQVLCHNCNKAKYKKSPISKPIIGKNKVCSVCKMSKDISLFKTHGTVCLECIRDKNSKSYSEAKLLLGGKCICCGETNLEKFTGSPKIIEDFFVK